MRAAQAAFLWAAGDEAQAETEWSSLCRSGRGFGAAASAEAMRGDDGGVAGPSGAGATSSRGAGGSVGAPPRLSSFLRAFGTSRAPTPAPWLAGAWARAPHPP